MAECRQPSKVHFTSVLIPRAGLEPDNENTELEPTLVTSVAVGVVKPSNSLSYQMLLKEDGFTDAQIARILQVIRQVSISTLAADKGEEPA